MNIVPKEFRKMQEFQLYEIPSAAVLFGRVQGMSIPRSSSDQVADFTSRQIDQLEISRNQVLNDYADYVDQMNHNEVSHEVKEDLPEA